MRLALIIDKKLFPDGFTKIREGAEAMGGRLGLWCSPLSYYPSAVDPQRALDHGYESFEIPGTKSRLLSLAGEKYLETTIEEVHRPAPVKRIKGVFLDSMELVSGKQGWGTLKKNRSVWDKEMVIGGKHFHRGLGTHANSEIVYRLGGKYCRFRACAGPDMATSGTMGFTVVVDGKKTRESPKVILPLRSRLERIWTIGGT